MTTATALNKLVIIGVGLIGGSFALALRKAGLVKHITGIGRSPANMQRAVELGVIDEIATDTAAALHNADLVFLAMPVGQTAVGGTLLAAGLTPRETRNWPEGVSGLNEPAGEM